MGENIGRAITAIYDAVLSDVHWPAALDAFAREIGSVGAVLVAVDKVGLPSPSFRRPAIIPSRMCITTSTTWATTMSRK